MKTVQHLGKAWIKKEAQDVIKLLEIICLVRRLSRSSHLDVITDADV